MKTFSVPSALNISKGQCLCIFKSQHLQCLCGKSANISSYYPEKMLTYLVLGWFNQHFHRCLKISIAYNQKIDYRKYCHQIFQSTSYLSEIKPRCLVLILISTKLIENSSIEFEISVENRPPILVRDPPFTHYGINCTVYNGTM